MDKINVIIIFSFLLFTAFQCEDEEYQPETTEPPQMPLSVSPNVEEIEVGDTLWIDTSVGSKVFHFELQDSIKWQPNGIFIFFYRLKHPANENDYNTTPAAGEFLFYPVDGTIEKEDYSWSHTPERHVHWDNLHRIVMPELSANEDLYQIKIGIIPQSIGYFALKCSNTFDVQRYNRSLYERFNTGETYLFFSKGRYTSSWQAIDNRIYFFKVIPQ